MFKVVIASILITILAIVGMKTLNDFYNYIINKSNEKEKIINWVDSGYDNCVIENVKGKVDVVRIHLQKNLETKENRAFLYDEHGNKFKANINIDAYQGMSFNADQIGYLLTFNYENKTCHLKILTDVVMVSDRKGFMSVTNNVDSQGNWLEVKAANSEIAKNIEKYNAKNNL